MFMYVDVYVHISMNVYRFEHICINMYGYQTHLIIITNLVFLYLYCNKMLFNLSILYCS